MPPHAGGPYSLDMTESSQSAGAPGGASGPAQTGRAGRAAESLSRAARATASRFGPAMSRFGNWLASIGWGKFVLLSLLLIALAGMADSLFSFSRRAHRHAPHVPVEMKITVDSEGLHVNGGEPPRRVHEPKVHIDDKGVRIESDKEGHSSTVVIDDQGVRIERGAAPSSKAPAAGAPAAPAVPGAESKLPEVTVPPGMVVDPEQVTQAVKAAKDQIEQIVQEQVDRRVARLERHRDEDDGWPGLPQLMVLMTFALLIVKIALGSKRRAETRAQAATAVAAEEGLKRRLAEAELKTMQAQVEPHFLFNTLASVDYLIETDPARASRMQKNLIQYLRAAVPQMRQASSTLGQEMALCRAYLEILKVRMDDRLQFAIALPAGLSSAAFPPMMLQTLVENSIKHGLEPKPEGGSLTLSADVVDGNLRVAVSDTGLGFGAAGLAGGGVGLSNVRERLQALFGARGRLSIEPNSPGGTIATLVVPYAVGTAEPAPQAAAQPA